MSLRTMQRAYRAELFGGKKGEITKKYLLGEDVKFKNKKEERKWWNWFRNLVSREARK